MKDILALENQVCFPIYTLAKEVIKCYRPFLDELDITYPQYLVLMVLWKEGEQSVSDLGEKLNLDSGTLTPLLKRLEQKQIVSRTRYKNDERIVHITLTKKGNDLKLEAQKVPQKVYEVMNIPKEDLLHLKEIVEKIIKNITQK